MSAKENVKLFTSGLLENNPTLIQLIGMCPTLALSTSLENGIGMGLAVTAVLTASNMVISLLRKLIPQKIRIAAYIVIISGFVTIIDLLMQAFLPALGKRLGIYIPLIVVNCIILARAEAFASKHGVWQSTLDGLGMGLGFTLSMCILSTIREIIGNGTILGHAVFGAAYKPALLVILPPGGFLTLGLVIATVQFIKSRKEREKK